MMLYNCTEFHENISELLGGHDFHSENFQRGIIPSQMQVELQFLISAYRLKMLYICIKFRENIPRGFISELLSGHHFHN